MKTKKKAAPIKQSAPKKAQKKAVERKSYLADILLALVANEAADKTAPYYEPFGFCTMKVAYLYNTPAEAKAAKRILDSSFYDVKSEVRSLNGLCGGGYALTVHIGDPRDADEILELERAPAKKPAKKKTR